MLTIEIELELDYPSKSLAWSVMEALEPDNRTSKGKMRITSRIQKKTLHIKIHDCPRVETMQSTLHDIFRCVNAAEATLPIANRLTTVDRKRRKNKRFK